MHTVKARASMNTAATEISSYYCDYSESSEVSDIHDEDLEEFDDLEKELFRFSRSHSRRNGLCSLSSDSETSGSSIRLKQETPTACQSTESPSREYEKNLKHRIERALSCNFYHQDRNETSAQQVMSGGKSKVNTQTPDACLRAILQGVSAPTFKSETWEGYFTAITSARQTAYNLNVSQAIRADKVSVLEQLHAQGTPLDSCNSYGESMIHLACRLGRLEIIKFLVDVAGVSIRVRDDAGRTPLHDACWTNKPNYELIQFLLDTSPELLFITDKRGFTAFRYIPPCCWQEWCAFLQDKQSFLRGKLNHSEFLKAYEQLHDAKKRLQILLLRAASFE